MTEAEIRSNIRYNEDLIDQYTQEKRDVEAQIDELDALKSKYSGLQSRFGERQQQRQTSLASMLGSGIQNSILHKYYSGMSGLLGGTGFNNAYDGLSEAKRRIDQKIAQLDYQRNDYEDKISYCKERHAYWRSQLATASAEETE